MVRIWQSKGAAMRRPRRLTVVAAGLLALAAISGQTSARPAPDPGERIGPSSPNIVMILTDDQRWDTLWAMPSVQADLADHGVTFDQGFVVNSLCCPSRVSILTGQYSHSTMVYGNNGQYGGFNSFHGDGSTVATWLHDAGYHTGLVGKYLNEYSGPYIPPGWDHWFAFTGIPTGASYYNYTIDDDGTYLTYGNAPEDYSTDVLAAEADSFIRGTDPQQPLFLYFAVKAPHIPATPAPRHANTFTFLPPYRPPNYNEADVSDKPAWVRALPLLSAQRQKVIDRQRRDAYRTLLAVDEAVGTIVAALTDTGRMSNTLIVFASDNGWAVGEHRWDNKKAAYEESLRIPLVIRYDPLTTTPRTDDHLVTNIDLAPTFAEVAGVPAPDAEGMSLVPVLQSPDPGLWRQDFLVEHLRIVPIDMPTYCAVRSEGFLYVAYTTREEELYDLTADPWELQNVATDPGYAETLRELRQRRAALCNPPPPPGG
jgi:N-acetylglucosamine-6-sulfatase